MQFPGSFTPSVSKKTSTWSRREGCSKLDDPFKMGAYMIGGPACRLAALLHKPRTVSCLLNNKERTLSLLHTAYEVPLSCKRPMADAIAIHFRVVGPAYMHADQSIRELSGSSAVLLAC